MTREEALRKVKGYLTDLLPIENYDEVEEIMSALEPEPILDKIKTEIKEIETYNGIYIDRYYVLHIINKYKAESEE